MKIDFEKYADMHTDIVVEGDDGIKVAVRNHIPAEAKVKMATEIVENVVMIHDDSCAYDSHLEELWKMLKMLEYYTDVDTKGVTPEQAADFMVNNGLYWRIRDVCDNDWDTVFEIYLNLKSSIIETFKDDHGLTKAVRTSFGFLFNGEDITESLAKAEATEKTIYDAVGALREKEQNDMAKVNNGKMIVGGNIINFSRKDPVA